MLARGLPLCGSGGGRKASRALLRVQGLQRQLQRLCLSSSAASSKWDYDVLIVGGGIVGASLACCLAESLGRRRGLKIGLVEGRAPPTLQALEQHGNSGIPDPRVYALAPASVKFLDSLGLSPLVKKRRQDFRCMQVWEAGASGSIRFDAAALHGNGNNGHADDDAAALGTMAENSTVQSALFERLRALEAEGLVDLSAVPGQVQAIAFDDGEKGTDPPGPARVTLAGVGEGGGGKKKQVTARLLVGADGAASRVKKARGLPSWGWDYGQRALVATVAIDAPEGSDGGGAAPSAATDGSSSSPAPAPPPKKPVTAWQVFLPDGPLALLPLWGRYHSIVWSTTPAEADRLRRLPPDAFLVELNTRLQTPVGLLDGPKLPPLLAAPLRPLEKALGGVHNLFESVVVSAALSQGFHLPPMVSELLTPRLGFDLRAEHATQYAAARAVLVGDAAHTIHPMAGQGLNLGIADVQALAEVLEAGVAEGADLGSPRLLRRYEEARQPANLAMLAGLTALHRLYGAEAGPLRWLRNVGLGALNGLGPLKARIAATAMGLELRGGLAPPAAGGVAVAPAPAAPTAAAAAAGSA